MTTVEPQGSPPPYSPTAPPNQAPPYVQNEQQYMAPNMANGPPPDPLGPPLPAVPQGGHSDAKYGTIQAPRDMADQVNPELKAYGCIVKSILTIIFIATFPVSLFGLFCIFEPIPEYCRGVIFRTGQILSQTASGPGAVIVLPLIDEMRVVDIRTAVTDVPYQTAMTKDSVQVKVNAVVYWHIHEPVKSLLNIRNVAQSVALVAQSALRNLLGGLDLTQALASRAQLTTQLQGELNAATDSWGVTIERVEVKDIRLPEAMMRSMAAEAEAQREARARKIKAEGEQKAAEALGKAAQLLTDSAAGLKLRFLQTMREVTSKKSNVIVMPLPVKLLQKWAN